MNTRFLLLALATAAAGLVLGLLPSDTPTVPQSAPAPAVAKVGDVAPVGDAYAKPASRRPAPVIPRIPRPARPAVETTALAEGYDPTHLLHLDHSAAELFAKEPRDPEWAPVAESARLAQVESDLAIAQPEARIKSLECRSAICEIVVEAPEELSMSTHFALQALGRADIHALGHIGPTENGGQQVVLYDVYSAERPLGPSDEAYAKRRRAMLRNAQIGAEEGAEPLTLPEE